MQTVEAIKRRIDNADELLSVVKTMKTLSAINIRQYERAAEALDDYYQNVELGFQVVLRHQVVTLPKGMANADGNVGIVIFGSDQGMCGQFNEQLTHFAMDELQKLGVSRSKRVMLALGSRLAAQLEAEEHPIDEAWATPGSVSGITPAVQDMLVKLDSWRALQGVERVFLFYNQPLSGASGRPTMFQLLPVNWQRFHHLAHKEWATNNIPLFTMDAQQLISALLRQYLFVTLFRAYALSLMTENASRLATMQSAERNIQDHLENLQMLYHQRRQQAITEELLDIIAGFETLTGATRPYKPQSSVSLPAEQ
jgi:F-type H+-transporting ATPase subunit gamma